MEMKNKLEKQIMQLINIITMKIVHSKNIENKIKVFHSFDINKYKKISAIA